ncbi:hypothetical protein [Gynurincola endophyticus]|uniref:hypothetical protein n=1 Tax=Gynurincola endophyticus TaxID=2479004 RepID=UPI000F8F0180|nr:hypothetical protein [Gynurincola endophyticus]
MKKFFQIAAFAVVGFIAFTSAKAIGPDNFYAIPQTTHPVKPTDPNTCAILRNGTVEGGVIAYWALRSSSLNRFVKAQDLATNQTIEEYISTNLSFLSCEQIFLIQE